MQSIGKFTFHLSKREDDCLALTNWKDICCNFLPSCWALVSLGIFEMLSLPPWGGSSQEGPSTLITDGDTSQEFNAVDEVTSLNVSAVGTIWFRKRGKVGAGSS